MEDTLFNSPEKKASATLYFQSLQEHQGWQLLVQVVKANIAVLKEQLENGLENETIETVKEIRAKIKIHQNIINTPADMIKGFNSGEPVVPELDPYPKTLEESKPINQRKTNP